MHPVLFFISFDFILPQRQQFAYKVMRSHPMAEHQKEVRERKRERQNVRTCCMHGSTHRLPHSVPRFQPNERLKSHIDGAEREPVNSWHHHLSALAPAPFYSTQFIYLSMKSLAISFSGVMYLRAVDGCSITCCTCARKLSHFSPWLKIEFNIEWNLFISSRMERCRYIGGEICIRTHARITWAR